MPIGMIAHARIRVYHAGDPAAPSCEKEEGGHVYMSWDMYALGHNIAHVAAHT
jgi:hypothetical protein